LNPRAIDGDKSTIASDVEERFVLSGGCRSRRGITVQL
jgi:hypothetical protein